MQGRNVTVIQKGMVFSSMTAIQKGVAFSSMTAIHKGVVFSGVKGTDKGAVNLQGKSVIWRHPCFRYLSGSR